jgi:senataxin
MGAAQRGLLLDRWRRIQEDEEAYEGGEPSTAKRRRLNQAKEEWYSSWILPPNPLSASHHFANESHGFSAAGLGSGYRRLERVMP